MEHERISHFDLLGPLGAGGMGEVYRARDSLLGRDVAIKLIRPGHSDDPQARGRFLRECRAAAALSHPGIATIYEAGETEDGRLFYACELVRGETVAERLGRGALAPREVLDLGLQLADALAAAHAQGIVHRDVKPANLMLTPEGRLKVLDFGLARLAPTREEEPAGATQTLSGTRPGVVVGTPAYMSPEQAVGAPVDARSDVFSAGCVLWEMAVGRPAFAGDSLQTTLRRVLSEDPPRADVSAPGIPPALGAVIVRALAKEPVARWADGRALAEALRPLVTGVHPAAPAPAPRRLRLGLAAGAAGVFVLVAAAVLWWSTRPGLAFASSDKLLIAGVDNQTGDEAFDLALRAALESDLQRSHYVTVFDQGQIADTLRLMRKDPTIHVDESLGRDLCRFAGVRGLLLPRILAVGEAFELQAILVDPVTGRHVDQVRVTARGREAVLLEGIDELAREVRARLGESLSEIARADEPIAQVTTSSWEALSYFALANSRISEGRFQDAASLLDLALQKDPEFLGARAVLGLLLIQFMERPDEGRKALQQAFEASAALPEYERLMLHAVHRQFVGRDLPGALAEYRNLQDLYPNRMEPVHNSGHILQVLGRYDEAVAAFERALALSSQGQFSLTSLFWLEMRDRHRARAAEGYARRLVALGPDTAMFHHYLAWSLWAQLRFEEALEECRRTLALDPLHPYAQPNLGHLLLATGRAAEAAEAYRALIEHGGHRPRALAFVIAALREAGREEEAQQLARAEIAAAESARDTNAVQLLEFALVAASAGDDAAAEALLRRATAQDTSSVESQTRLAELHAYLGRPAEAAAAIERCLAGGFWDRYLFVLLPGLRGLHDDARFRAAVGIETVDAGPQDSGAGRRARR